MRYTPSTFLIGLTILLALSSVCLFVWGPELINWKLSQIEEKDRELMAAVFNGMFAPIIAWVAAVLTFAAFYVQYKANNRQIQQFEKQNQDQIFFRLLDSQESRIINSSFFNENNQAIKSYQILEEITKEFKKQIHIQLPLLSRDLIVANPHIIPENLLIRMFQLEISNQWEIIKNLSSLKNSFYGGMEGLNRNDRWEFIKRYFGSLQYETDEQLNVLHSIASVNFYKISFEERQNIYRQAFQKVEQRFGSFTDSYLRGWNLIASFVEQSIDKETYLGFIRNQLSKFEMILLFYYMGSGNASDKLKKLIRKNELLKNLHQYNMEFIDLPSENELAADLKDMLRTN